MAKQSVRSQGREQLNHDGDDSSDNKKKKVLTKALFRAAGILDLKGPELSKVLGISEPTISRIKRSDNQGFDPKSNEGQLAAMLIRTYRSLSGLIGNEPEQMRQWLRSENKYFEATPIKHMETVEGFVDVVRYLDAMRG